MIKLLLSVALLLALLFPSFQDNVAHGQASQSLKLGDSVTREFVGGQPHSYKIALTAGQYLEVVVEQRGIDLAVLAFDPSGRQIAKMNMFRRGAEPISIIAHTTGSWRVETVATDSKAATNGSYELRIVEQRVAAAPDIARINAERNFELAEDLLFLDTPESRQSAIEQYNEALAAWRAEGDKRREARTLNSLGLAHLKPNPRLSLEYQQQALPLWRATNDRLMEATTLFLIGSAYAASFRIKEAIEPLEQSLPMFREEGDRGLEAASLMAIGGVYLLSAPQKAITYFNQSLGILQSLEDREKQRHVLGLLSMAHRGLGQKEKAAEFAARASALLEAAPALKDNPESPEAIRQAADRVFAEAAGLLGLEKPELIPQAIEKLQQALQLWRKLGDKIAEANTMMTIGGAYVELRDYQKGISYLLPAFALWQAADNLAGMIGVLLYLGKAYAELGQGAQAMDSYQRALSFSQSAAEISGEGLARFGIARAERARDNLPEACAQMEAVLNLVESSRARITGEEPRASYLAKVHEYYEFYIDLLMQLHRQRPTEEAADRALEAAERARARSLIELLTEARADIRQSLDGAMLALEREAQQRLNAAAERQRQVLNGKHTKEQATAARLELDARMAELEQAEAQIRRSSPRYAALKYPAPVNLPEMQQLLDADTLLLEYALGEERSYLWAVTPDSVSGFELPGRVEVETAARRVYELLSATPRQAREATFGSQYPQAANALSRLLFAAVSAQLGQKRLLIVADGALQYVSFAALPDPNAAHQPLIANHEIVSLPSASTLAALRRELAGRTTAPKLVAVLADPVFEPDDVRFGKRAGKAALPKPQVQRSEEEAAVFRSAVEVGITDAQQRFQRLTFSRREAEAILALAPAQTGFKALDFAANRAAAVSPGLAQYRIVHFATHGLLNSLHPSLSGVVLSLVDERGRPQDGFLRLHDIYNLKLNADLVVLSACQTALGKEVRGEGLIGLTRGFMYAGAPRVLASLWKVEDSATAELMKRFYRRLLGEGMRPAAALRAAQMDMQRQPRWASPRCWAGFVLQGEWK